MEKQSGPNDGYRTWLFRLDRLGAKQEALKPTIEDLPYWTVGLTGGGGTVRFYLAEVVLMENWPQADTLWWALVRQAIDETLEHLQAVAVEEGRDPASVTIAEAEDLVLAHIQAEQPHLLDTADQLFDVGFTYFDPELGRRVALDTELLTAPNAEAAGCRMVERLKARGHPQIRIESIELASEALP